MFDVSEPFGHWCVVSFVTLYRFGSIKARDTLCSYKKEKIGLNAKNVIHLSWKALPGADIHELPNLIAGEAGRSPYAFG